VLDVIGTLHWRGVSTGVESDLETGRSNRPRIGGAHNYLRLVADRLVRVRRGEIGEGDLVANTGLLLVPVGEGGLTGQGLG